MGSRINKIFNVLRMLPAQAWRWGSRIPSYPASTQTHLSLGQVMAISLLHLRLSFCECLLHFSLVLSKVFALSASPGVPIYHSKDL
jgi:hypothetical protein